MGSLLAQCEQIHVTPTSPLFPLLVESNELLNRLDVQYTFDKIAVGDRLYRSLARLVHADVSRPIIFDKHRGWPKHIPSIKEFVDPEPRIIATVRPIAEVITSYLVLADKDPANFIDKHLKQLGASINNESRADLLWREYVGPVHGFLKHGLDNYPQSILLIDYAAIVNRTEEVLGDIRAFCGLPQWDLNAKSVKNYCAEDKDHAWGMKDLHNIRPVVECRSTDPRKYLPKAAIDYFSQHDVRNR